MIPRRRLVPLVSLAALATAACASRPAPPTVLASAPAPSAGANAPQPASAAPSATPPAGAPQRPDPPETHRVRHRGWSLAVPDGWTEVQAGQGEASWRSPPDARSGNSWIVNMSLVHGGGSLDEIAALMPGEWRRRGAEATQHRISHGGHDAAEVLVEFPEHARQVPMYVAVLVQGHRGVVVTCAGERDATIEEFCRAVLHSTWFGAASATPPARTAEGMRWLGGQGRFVQVPSDFQTTTPPAVPLEQGTSAANAGDTRAVDVRYLDNLTLPASEVLAGAVQGLTTDAATHVARQQPVRRPGGITGVEVDAERRAVTDQPATLLQWIVPAGPQAFLTLNCVGGTAELAAQPRVCRGILESLRAESAP
jgi:hypothetical protein